MSQPLSGNSARRSKVSSLDDTDLIRVELTSLRNEIVTRVIFQNVLLCLTWCSLGLILSGAVLWQRAELLLVQSVLGLSAAAMWAHHGARTAQIRSYLTSTVEPTLGARDHDTVSGWEHALAGMRFRSLLGSRWFVSTKGFFLGGQLIVATMLFASDVVTGLGFISLGALGGTVWVLHDPPLNAAEEERPATVLHAKAD